MIPPFEEQQEISGVGAVLAGLPLLDAIDDNLRRCFGVELVPHELQVLRFQVLALEFLRVNVQVDSGIVPFHVESLILRQALSLPVLGLRAGLSAADGGTAPDLQALPGLLLLFIHVLVLHEAVLGKLEDSAQGLELAIRILLHDDVVIRVLLNDALPPGGISGH
jgi:hypothetical protein